MSIRNVSKIAILNPYLGLGLTDFSDKHYLQSFIDTAQNLNIETAIFKRSNEIYDFNPDFVISISPQEPKLTHFPTYGLLLRPINWITNSKRFTRNLLTYDGYFTPSDITKDGLKKLCHATNKIASIDNATFSVARTEFKPLDFRNATAAYLGDYWENVNYFSLFNHLEDGEYVKCYGSKEAWQKLSAKLYGGEIARDSLTAMKKFAEHGIGLCLQHPDIDNEGIPAKQAFEISAACGITICTQNSYMQNNFGDSILYIDRNLSPKELANAVKEKIMWIRANQNQAIEMAKSAHDIFNRQLSQEFFLENMLKMHNDVLNQYGYIKTNDINNDDKVTYLIHINDSEALTPNLINQFTQQTYTNIQVILLFDEQDTTIQTKIKSYLSQNILSLNYTGIESNPALFKFLQNSNTTWLGIAKTNDKLFSNHCISLLKAYQNSAHDRNKENITILVANSLEHSAKSDLQDKIQDNQILYPTSDVRVGNIIPNAKIPLCATLFKLNSDILSAFSNSDFSSNIRIDFQPSNDPLEIAIHNNFITCSSSVIENEKQAELVIHNSAGTPNSESEELKEIKHRDYQSTLDRIFYEPTQSSNDTKKYKYAVSIILRTKDRPICLPRAIKSILNQTFKDWQLVIVNDGGNLDTLKPCLQPLAQALQDRLIFIHNPVSLGMSRALNMAIDESSSEFIVVHDDDDTWQPEFLIQTVSFLRNPENNDCCAVITHSTRVVEEIVNDTIIERSRTDYNAGQNPFTRVSLYRLLMQNMITTNAYLFKRSIIDKIGYFNEDLPVLNDWDFNIRCALHHEIGVIPQYLANYHHRVNQQNTTYGNSIIHTSNLCLQYETVIRNRGLRNLINSKNHSELLGLVFALGGHSLQSLAVPDYVAHIANFLQQLPQWIEKNTKTTVENEMNSLKTQLSVLQMKLDRLLTTNSSA